MTISAVNRRAPWGAAIIKQAHYAPDGGHRYYEDIATNSSLAAAGLDWQVTKEPVHIVVPAVIDDNGVIPERTIVVPDQFALTAQPTHVAENPRPLGSVVGSRYVPIQNDKLEAFTHQLTDGTGAEVVTFGSSHGGRAVWSVVKLRPEDLLGGYPDEAIATYALTTNWHGGQSFTCSTIPLRLACVNGLLVTMPEHSRTWKIRHTGSTAWKMGDVRESLNLASQYLDELIGDLDRLANTVMSEWEFSNFLESLVPDPKPGKDARQTFLRQQKVAKERSMITRNYHYSPTIQSTNIAGTRYGALNAVAELDQWVRPVRGVRDDGRTSWLMDAMVDDRFAPRVERAHRLLAVPS